MREDFNKLMVERERIGHDWKFNEVRNAKANRAFDEDTLGGKESMHKQRRGAKGGANSRKRFNENLNPLINFLRGNAGRPWDKIYSEICETFDKRKVINNHILEHLFDYVKLNVHIIDGKPHTISRWSDSGYSEISYSNNYPTYYVDPRDGLMKAPKQGRTQKQIDAENAIKIAAQIKARYHKIDENNHLFFKDGIWWHYMAKARPAKVEQVYYEQLPWKKHMANPPIIETPEELEARKRTRMVDAPLRDKLEVPNVPGYARDNGYYRRAPKIIPDTKYFFHRRTASHKQLKAAGVAGTATANDEQPMSRREASKYRPKKAA